MKKKLIIVCLFVLHFTESSTQSFDYSVTPDFDQSNNIREYLSKAASAITQHSLTEIKNLEDWEAVREARYQEFLEMMGLQGKPFKGKRSPKTIYLANTLRNKFSVSCYSNNSLMPKKKQIKIQDIVINWQTVNNEDYISLTDMVKGRRSAPGQIINNWLRNRNNLELIALLEQMINPNFKSTQFEHFYMNQVGKNDFVPTVNQFIKDTDAISLQSKRGRGGGTWAHRDLAFSFGAFISPAFQLLLIREFQRLKADESERKSLEWDANRFLTKRNYHIQTEAVRAHLVPDNPTEADPAWIKYAEEADLLNKALFGLTAKEWKMKNFKKDLDANQRDHATTEQLIILSNMEAINAHLIKLGMSKEDRYAHLKMVVATQLPILLQIGADRGNQLLDL